MQLAPPNSVLPEQTTLLDAFWDKPLGWRGDRAVHGYRSTTDLIVSRFETIIGKNPGLLSMVNGKASMKVFGVYTAAMIHKTKLRGGEYFRRNPQSVRWNACFFLNFGDEFTNYLSDWRSAVITEATGRLQQEAQELSSDDALAVSTSIVDTCASKGSGEGDDIDGGTNSMRPSLSLSVATQDSWSTYLLKPIVQEQSLLLEEIILKLEEIEYLKCPENFRDGDAHSKREAAESTAAGRGSAVESDTVL